MKKQQFAVPVASPEKPSNKAWALKMSTIAAWGAGQCQANQSCHSAICTITGEPKQLVVNLSCTAKSEGSLAELVNLASDQVIPEMERRLGVQFEVRNLQFAVAGHEDLLSEPEHVEEAAISTAWLDHPLQIPHVAKLEMA